jgi:hypothetical protein
MQDTKTQLDSIQEAYMGVITEGKETKFKVGDKVGIGAEGKYDPVNYQSVDTGTVSKIDKLGNHVVMFDNRKSNDSPVDNLTHKFDSLGMSISGHGLKILPIEEHEKRASISHENDGRKNDISHIVSQLTSLKNGYGNYSKLSKEHVAHIKSLLDKHTEE